MAGNIIYRTIFNIFLSAGFCAGSTVACNKSRVGKYAGRRFSGTWTLLYSIPSDINPRSVKGPQGEDINAARVSSFLSMQQFVYESHVPVWNGNLAFSLLAPLVRLSGSGEKNNLSTNPGIVGGIILGPVIQWSNKHFFGLRYAHRAEVDIAIPLGAYNDKYDVNPSSHFFTLTAYYAFTVFLNEQLSISTRNNFNYNFRKIDSGDQSGAFYNINYAIEHTVYKKLRAELAGYFLKQLTQDAFYGNRQYYQDTYKISDTRERVLAIGPGLSYVTPGGLAAELKAFFETGARNRTEGVRPTFKVAYKLK
ncbi:hypothetical protein TH53_02105 [Pedobacter lusitanus]|uniref:Transporter n=1 Tax=Pedobacter lusitanus TaxID=1503925 RepID=A0A0D0GR69_9SPHI|nr:transporter [Pedobacter lusitanus]KIO78700.1 hypothetical protein TH53_02105 [Pedobacter lusitanus]